MDYYGHFGGNVRLICLFIYALQVACSLSNGFTSRTFGDQFKEEIRREMCKNQLRKNGYDLKRPLLNLCQQNTGLFKNAIEGFKQGITECKATFKRSRWNCTTPASGDVNVLFGIAMARGSKEAAVMVAMASAGMVERITVESYKKRRGKQQTIRGGCNQLRRARNARASVNTNDCDADVTKGDKYAHDVIESWISPQKSSKKDNLMNLHNAAVGRLAVREHMKQVCRCVGLSGACNAKCCYRQLQPLKVSAEWLRKKYNTAKKVKTGPRPKRDGTGLLITADGSDTPRKTDLIYLHDSPNYCQNDPSTGSLGTIGRKCSVASNDTDSCDIMCCGRGYETHELEEDGFCNCKFNWCCEVKCEVCRRPLVIHRCK